jgi:conjugative transposon TraK protein
MFPKTRNIETSFRAMRVLSLTVIIGNLLLTGLLFAQAARVEERAAQRIYILSAGKALEAFAGDRDDNLRAEAEWHVKNFHSAFFTLEPDEKFNSAGMKRALYLADGSAKRVYDNLKESGYYAEVVSANISQQLTVDSVVLDMARQPFHFRFYGTETITRATSVVTRDLVTEGWLRITHRSEDNEHGMLIERWAILDNRDLKVEAR